MIQSNAISQGMASDSAYARRAAWAKMATERAFEFWRSIMKKIATLAALAVLGAALPAAAQSQGHAPICLQSYDIDRTTVVNPQKILFRLKDGKVYSSKLRSPCLGLRFNGFVYVTPVDEICGGSQSIRVLQTNQVCVLGPFQPEQIGAKAG